jgi:c-di-GMP-binding flagellar brake protein YcgR
MPEKVNALSEELAAKINLVEKENEEENSHKRSQPRKQATGKQTIKAYKEGNEKKKQTYNLYDISAGGLALKTIDPGMFKKGDFITITSINSKDLDMIISGEVVSVRHMEEDDVFKVGVRFV